MGSSEDRFREMFFEEARELLISLEEGLMDLERRQGDRAHLDKTFRAAHSLKGAGAMVGLEPIAKFTHGIEAVLEKIRAGSLAVDSDIITTLLESRDHLAAMVEGEAAGSPIPGSGELSQRLGDLLRSTATPPAAVAPPAPPVPASVSPSAPPPAAPPPAARPRVPASGQTELPLPIPPPDPAPPTKPPVHEVPVGPSVVPSTAKPVSSKPNGARGKKKERGESGARAEGTQGAGDGPGGPTRDSRLVIPAIRGELCGRREADLLPD